MQNANNPISGNILIVDDTPANIRVLVEVLSARGHQVRSATSGERALGTIRKKKPDLVLLDIRMPGMDGYEVCRELKAHPETENIPVIFLSMASEIEDKLVAFQVGGVDYIAKPIQIEEVIVRVENHLKLRSMEEALRRSEARFRRIYEEAPVMIHSVDEQGIVRNVNSKWIEKMGYGRDEVMGKPIGDFMTEASRDQMGDVLPRFWRDEKISELPRQFVKRDGTVMDVLLDSVLFEDPILGKVGVSSMLDITRRKRAEENFKVLYKESKETEHLYRSLLESSLDPIVTYDMEGHVTFVNNAFIETFGWTKEELAEGVPYTPDSEREVTYQNVMKVTREGIPLRNFETRRLTKHGGLIDVNISASRFNDHEDRPAGMLVILRDISERKQAEKDLAETLETTRRLRDEAQKANRAKSEFVANMSHEIRTPMNAIIGFTDLALRMDLSRKLRNYLTKIRSSSKSLLGVINDVLDFSKIEAGRLDMESVPFDVRNVVRRMSDVVCTNEACSDIEFLISIDPDVPSALVGDPLRLEQVLTNLSNNAVKFTTDGEVLVKVESMDKTGDKVVLKFSVRDTGIGIEADKLPTLFDPFTQADGSTTRKFGGSGLGLTICRRLINLMGGEIEVESATGKGSLFTFQLAFQALPRKMPVHYPTPFDMRGMRVLMVDDNAMSREILEMMLNAYDFRVTAVCNGTEALEELIAADGNDPYSLVLLDWKMPGIDGIETARRIDREEGLSGRIPKIIMVTAFGTEDVRTSAEKAGIDGYLTKPVQPSLLLDTIMNVFGKAVPEISSDARARASEALDAANIRGARILIAEDNEINREVAKEILEGAGVVVHMARNGKEAVEAVHESEFHAVLMDIQMPEMDGFEATRLIRSDARFKNLPIIAMTAHAMRGDREKCLAGGMDDHVPKPVNTKELFPTLSKWISLQNKSVGRDAGVSRETETIVDESWEPLDGFNVKETLDRLGIGWPVLRKLLIKFKSNHSGSLGNLVAALDTGDAETARGIAHGVKGMSGNLGATDLHVAAKDLESSIKNGAVDRMDTHLERFSNAFHQAMGGLSALEPPVENSEFSADGISEETEAPAPKRCAPLMFELAGLMKSCDFASRDKFQKLRENLDNDRFGLHMAGIEKHLSRYEFEEALTALAKLAETIGVDLD